jgi:ferredoxin
VHIRVDKSLCVGHGQCFTCAPDLFPLDQYGYVDITSIEVPAGREADAIAAVQGCPERALLVEESSGP